MAPGTRELITSDRSGSDVVKREVGITQGSESRVLKALSVWIKKPHVANRRLCGASILSVHRYKTRAEVDERLDKLRETERSEGRRNGTEQQTGSFGDLSEETENFTLLERELIPRSEFSPNVSEAIVYDKAKKSVEFWPLKRKNLGKLQTEELFYTVQFREKKQNGEPHPNEIVLTCETGDDNETTGEVRRQVSWQWLHTALLGKLVNWSQISDISTSLTSLQLVKVEQYKETYVRLKNTYGRDLVKNWTERTDPQKFVHEDVAIAAYLLLIWEEDRKKKKLTRKQTFVDLGCGNGLLVYILTKEGHKGRGIDQRKRKIWDTFGDGIDLEEKTITPSSAHLFPEYDWIIGNHSDELTPWIPVIAARSSYQCNVFVLPCCPHDFQGKFSHIASPKSVYGAYLDHVENIISQCGFKPERDTLRIPSTKRVCFIGRQRDYEESSEAEADSRRQSFINERISKQEALLNVPSKAQSKNKEESVGRKRQCSHTDEYESVSTVPELSTSKVEGGRGSDVTVVTQADPTDESRLSSLTTAYKRLLSETDTIDSGLGSLGSDFIDLTPSPTSTPWSQNFKPRVEPGVRNCQTVPEEVKKSIVDSVFEQVLSSDTSDKADLGGGRTWRRGGAVPLEKAVKTLDKVCPGTLKKLKAECGGLQTLLRNHSHVFQVSGGAVRLRDFSAEDPFKGRRNKKSRGDAGRHKTMLCWFYGNHPDGCPRASNNCRYAHGDQELLRRGPD